MNAKNNSNTNIEIDQIKAKTFAAYRNAIDAFYFIELRKHFKPTKVVEIINSTRDTSEGKISHTHLLNIINGRYRKGGEKS